MTILRRGRGNRCSSKCPICKNRCEGASRHVTSPLHQCSYHCWGTLDQMHKQSIQVKEQAYNYCLYVLENGIRYIKSRVKIDK